MHDPALETNEEQALAPRERSRNPRALAPIHEQPLGVAEVTAQFARQNVDMIIKVHLLLFAVFSAAWFLGGSSAFSSYWVMMLTCFVFLEPVVLLGILASGVERAVRAKRAFELARMKAERLALEDLDEEGALAASTPTSRAVARAKHVWSRNRVSVGVQLGFTAIVTAVVAAVAPVSVAVAAGVITGACILAAAAILMSLEVAFPSESDREVLEHQILLGHSEHDPEALHGALTMDLDLPESDGRLTLAAQSGALSPVGGGDD